MGNIPFEKPEFFMRQALLQAVRAWKKGEVPVGALVVSETGQILSSAHNNPVSLDDPTAHAEILAIRKAGLKTGNYRLTGAWMFVTLEPCIMCAGALVWARLKGVIYGAGDPKTGALGSVTDINEMPGINHRLLVDGGILEEECSRLLKDFFKRKRANKKASV